MKEDSALVFVAETKGLMEPPVIRKNSPSLTERKMVGLRERDDQDKDQDRGLLSRGNRGTQPDFLCSGIKFLNKTR